MPENNLNLVQTGNNEPKNHSVLSNYQVFEADFTKSIEIDSLDFTFVFLSNKNKSPNLPNYTFITSSKSLT